MYRLKPCALDKPTADIGLSNIPLAIAVIQLQPLTDEGVLMGWHICPEVAWTKFLKFWKLGFTVSGLLPFPGFL